MKQGLQKWWREIRPAHPNFDPKTVLDSDGRFQETFQRLRRERNDTPIVLAE